MNRQTILNIATYLNADYAMLTLQNGEFMVGHARNVVSPDHEGFDFAPTEESRFWLTQMTGCWFDVFVPISEVAEVQALDQDTAREYAKSVDEMARR